MATGTTRYRPDWGSGGIQVPDAGSVLLDFADRMAKQQDRDVQLVKQAEEQRRWDIANARAEAEWNRKQQEQKSADAYYDILANGPQTKGGVLNTQALISESSKYDLTPEEIELTKTIQTPEQARAAGNEQLANKIAWQQNLSNFVGQNYASEALQESRPEMYERAMGKVKGQGLPTLPGMVDKLDIARLAETEAETKKLKDIDDRIADLKKDELSMVKWAIGQQNVGSGGSSPVVDTEGNITGYTSNAQNKREVTLDDKYDVNKAAGEQLILGEVNKLQVPDKKTTGEDALKLYREIIKDPTVDPKSAATAVVGGIGTKEGAWYNPWSKSEGTFKDNAVKDLVGLLKGTRTPEEVGSAGSTGGTAGNTFKSNAARDVAILSGAQNAAELSKLQAQRAALLQGGSGRQEDRVNELLRNQGILPTATTSQSTSAVGTSKMPQSLVQAEGVRNEPYKDSKGIVTVGIGYAFNKDRSEIESDFKAAGIPLSKIDGLMKQDGTKLTNQEVAALGDVAYDRYGVQKLNKLGIDINTINPTLAEIGVAQAYRGDIVKGGEGYRGKLYEFLKNDDLAGMTNYVKSNKEVPKEVKQRMALVTDRFGAMTKEQATYEGIPTGTSSNNIKDLFNRPITVDGKVDMTQIGGTIDMSKLLEPEKQETKVRPGWEVIRDTLKSGLNTTYAQGKGMLTDLFGPILNRDSKAGTAILATLNNSAAGMLEIAGSPYTATKMFTDWLMTGKTSDSVFQKNAEQARDTAIKALNEAGVTDPTNQEIAMVVSDIIIPVGGISTFAKGLKSGTPALTDRLSKYIGDDLGNIRGPGFTMEREGVLQGTSKAGVVQAKNMELQQEVASLVSGDLNPDKIKRLYDIAATNPTFNKPIRDFLRTRGF